MKERAKDVICCAEDAYGCMEDADDFTDGADNTRLLAGEEGASDNWPAVGSAKSFLVERH